MFQFCLTRPKPCITRRDDEGASQVTFRVDACQNYFAAVSSQVESSQVIFTISAFSDYFIKNWIVPIGYRLRPYAYISRTKTLKNLFHPIYSIGMKVIYQSKFNLIIFFIKANENYFE